jgi:hypothetical protein
VQAELLSACGIDKWRRADIWGGQRGISIRCPSVWSEFSEWSKTFRLLPQRGWQCHVTGKAYVHIDLYYFIFSCQLDFNYRVYLFSGMLVHTASWTMHKPWCMVDKGWAKNHSSYWEWNLVWNWCRCWLQIDREHVLLMPISFLSHSDVPEGDQGANEVQVGGLNTSDPRFAVYKNYKGCLSSKWVYKTLKSEFVCFKAFFIMLLWEVSGNISDSLHKVHENNIMGISCSSICLSVYISISLLKLLIGQWLNLVLGSLHQSYLTSLILICIGMIEFCLWSSDKTLSIFSIMVDDAVALQPRPGLGLPFGFHDSLY